MNNFEHVQEMGACTGEDWVTVQGPPCGQTNTRTYTWLKTLPIPLRWRSVKGLKKLHDPLTKHFFGTQSDLFCLHLLCPSLVLTDESVETDYHKGLSFCQNESGG